MGLNDRDWYREGPTETLAELGAGFDDDLIGPPRRRSKTIRWTAAALLLLFVALTVADVAFQLLR
jgi:hypothetical protein